jgi:hypothetical protein
MHTPVTGATCYPLIPVTRDEKILNLDSAITAHVRANISESLTAQRGVCTVAVTPRRKSLRLPGNQLCVGFPRAWQTESTRAWETVNPALTRKRFTDHCQQPDTIATLNAGRGEADYPSGYRPAGRPIIQGNPGHWRPGPRGRNPVNQMAIRVADNPPVGYNYRCHQVAVLFGLRSPVYQTGDLFHLGVHIHVKAHFPLMMLYPCLTRFGTTHMFVVATVLRGGLPGFRVAKASASSSSCVVASARM